MISLKIAPHFILSVHDIVPLSFVLMRFEFQLACVFNISCSIYCAYSLHVHTLKKANSDNFNFTDYE